MHHHSGLPWGLGILKTFFISSPLGVQQGLGGLMIAPKLHLHVAEVRQTLIIGGIFPQPHIGSLGAREGRKKTGISEQLVPRAGSRPSCFEPLVREKALGATTVTGS